MGVDDYVVKLVQLCVLFVCICVLLCCIDKVLEDEVVQCIEFDDLVIDNGGCLVILNGELVDFISVEYDLLWLLVLNVGCIFFCEDIFECLCGIEYDG